MLLFNKYQSYHYNITKPFFGIGGVAVVAIQVLLFIGYKSVYFIGFDGDGLFKELYKKKTHVYGYNADNLKKNFIDYSLDFYQVSLFFKNMEKFSCAMIKLKKNIINCSSEGIINFFPRKKLKEIFKKK